MRTWLIFTFQCVVWRSGDYLIQLLLEKKYFWDEWLRKIILHTDGIIGNACRDHTFCCTYVALVEVSWCEMLLLVVLTKRSWCTETCNAHLVELENKKEGHISLWLDKKWYPCKNFVVTAYCMWNSISSYVVHSVVQVKWILWYAASCEVLV